jgi:adenylate cyclase
LRIPQSSPFVRTLAIGAAATLLAAAFGCPAFGPDSFGKRAEVLAYDARVQWTARPDQARRDIAIIEIDDQSVQALERIYGRWPWPRLAHAAVVRYLSRAPARVIAYDVLFTEPHLSGEFRVGDSMTTGSASDQQFIDEVRRAGNVVLAANAVDVTAAQLPFEELRGSAAAIGHNAVSDPSGVTRSMLPRRRTNLGELPSLGVAAAEMWQGAPVAALGEAEVLLRFRGPFKRDAPGSPYPVYPFFNVLLSEEQILTGQPPAIDPAQFRDKLVFIGAGAAGLFDTHSDPFGVETTPGVLLQATSADNVLSGEYMQRAPFLVDLAVTACAALITTIAAMALPVWGLALTAMAVAAALVGGTTALVANGYWLALVSPLLAVVFAIAGSYTWRYVVEDREKRRVKKLFGRYVSKDVFDELMTNPALAQLGGERREMTVLFSDIRGFTTASEKSTPEAVVAQLNEYFGEMVDVLFRHRGTLDKFVGDMVMGLFGAPVADPLHADHAVQAALEMMAVLERLNVRWVGEGRPRLDIGVGISSGVMIAGNIGSSAIMSYTVIGDAVNLGARLESLNKDYGTHILMSEATRARLTMPVNSRKIGEVTVKGKTQPVMVYEVMS